MNRNSLVVQRSNWAVLCVVDVEYSCYNIGETYESNLLKCFSNRMYRMEIRQMSLVFGHIFKRFQTGEFSTFTLSFFL